LIALLLIGLIVFLLPVREKTFADLYDEDEGTIITIEKFREIPLQSLAVDGTDWNYLHTGTGERALLFLHGMGGAYDIWFQQIQPLKYEFKIISITLPEVHSLAEAVAGITAILDAEGVEKTSIIGTSMGGYIAQYFLQHHPDRLDRLVLGNTFPPNHLYKRENGGMRRLVPFLPEWFIMKKFRNNVREKVVPASENSALVEAYLNEQYSGYMSKSQFIGRMDVVLDYFDPVFDSTQVNIPKLIIESDNDPLIPPILQEAIRSLYPESRVFTFEGKGHFPYLNQPEEYTQALRRFLD
jgi:pimeloyl-ACP methyl ester carboxylesterase